MKRKEFMKFIEDFKTLRDNIDDQTASTAAGLYPSMKLDGRLVKAGARININGRMYRARVDLWDTEENTPDKAPNLWEAIEYHKGLRHIPEVITAENPFMKDEKGWWKEKIFKSLLDNNVWTPDAYSFGWEEVNNDE